MYGSQKLIQQPVYGAGNVRNDYGLGFYCTENVDLAKEWACTEENSGYANCYQLDLGGLTILDLSDHRYHILNCCCKTVFLKYRMIWQQKEKNTC